MCGVAVELLQPLAAAPQRASARFEQLRTERGKVTVAKLSQRRAAQLCLLLAALIAEACNEPACGVADTVQILDNRNGLYLVYRASGWQEKAEFFETYRGQPTFDACGKANQPVEAKALYLRSEGLLKAVNANGANLEVEYTPDSSLALDPLHVKLSRQAAE
jgi:hypothetical protein